MTEPGPLCILYCGLTASVKENKIGHLQILAALYLIGEKTTCIAIFTSFTIFPTG